MPNGRSGGFDLITADLKHLITSTPQSEVGTHLADGSAKPKPCSSADVAAAVDSCQRAHVYIEEQDGAVYIIHISDDPILWVLVLPGSTLFAPLRERHNEWKVRRSEELRESQLPRPVRPTSFDKVAEPTDITKNARRLALVRGVHTLIYIVMAISTFVLVYAGLTGAQGWWLWVALILLAVETVVFAGNGMKCPLTALAVTYGAEKGYAFDTFLPERATRHTFRFFGTLMLIGLVLLALRWLG